MRSLIRGVSGTPEQMHPHWTTGEPIMVGDDVRTPDGWEGFVSSVSSDEVHVYAWGDSDYTEEFGPERITKAVEQ